MSLRTPRNSFGARDLGCAGRARRTSILASRIAAPDRPVVEAPGGAEPASPAPAPAAAILRRWSVAELIAQATWRADIA